MIQINGLTYSYKGQEPLFQQMNLALASGNIYGLLGKNGAGKSTLLKLVCGLLFPNQGIIEVAGNRPHLRHPQFLREVFLLSEEFQLPNFTIRQFVQFHSPFYPRFDHEAFGRYMEEFNLPYDMLLSAFSYGQKKKFMLSFGLATDCRLLILDEPTNGIDIPSKSLFRRLVADAIHEDRTFVISTHQVKDMENLIDPIIIIDEGEVIFNETCDWVSQNISVSRSSELPTSDDIIYSESNLGGHTVVTRSRGEVESSINLELLFNAVVNGKEQFYQLFQKEKV